MSVASQNISEWSGNIPPRRCCSDGRPGARTTVPCGSCLGPGNPQVVERRASERRVQCSGPMIHSPSLSLDSRWSPVTSGCSCSLSSELDQPSQVQDISSRLSPFCAQRRVRIVIPDIRHTLAGARSRPWTVYLLGGRGSVSMCGQASRSATGTYLSAPVRYSSDRGRSTFSDGCPCEHVPASLSSSTSSPSRATPLPGDCSQMRPGTWTASAGGTTVVSKYLRSFDVRVQKMKSRQEDTDLRTHIQDPARRHTTTDSGELRVGQQREWMREHSLLASERRVDVREIRVCARESLLHTVHPARDSSEPRACSCRPLHPLGLCDCIAMSGPPKWPA